MGWRHLGAEGGCWGHVVEAKGDDAAASSPLFRLCCVMLVLVFVLLGVGHHHLLLCHLQTLRETDALVAYRPAGIMAEVAAEGLLWMACADLACRTLAF